MLSSTLGAETGGVASIALQSDGAGGIIAALGLFFFVVPAVIGLVTIAGMWKAFAKAGQPGWAAIIPIYNIYVICEIADRDLLWLVLSIVFPIVLIVPLIDVAEKFGKGTGYGIGLYFLSFIFWPLLGFGDAEYQGSTA